jgi:hypothetical protein
MHSGERIVVTCSDAADEIRKWWFLLTSEEYNAYRLKSGDRSGYDTPEKKMYFNKLIWRIRSRVAALLFGSLR